MPIYKTKAHKLPVVKKTVLGDHVITKSTNNTDVTGNDAALAAFVQSHTELKAALATAVSAREASKQATTELNARTRTWTTKLNGLAGVTESLVSGDPAKLQGAGFDVRGVATPPQPLTAPEGLKVTLNGREGHSQLDWDTLTGADHFVIEFSPDPITPASWSFLNTATASSYEGNGALAGQKLWYRVAGVNALGRGPWSDPGVRPVM